jgi:hypothetical protein
VIPLGCHCQCRRTGRKSKGTYLRAGPKSDMAAIYRAGFLAIARREQRTRDSKPGVVGFRRRKAPSTGVKYPIIRIQNTRIFTRCRGWKRFDGMWRFCGVPDAQITLGDNGYLGLHHLRRSDGPFERRRCIRGTVYGNYHIAH